jgi:ribosomal protein S12 methylthiotransferase accessory factor
LEENGKFEQAIDFYKQALSREPNENDVASIHCHIGICLRETGQIDEAIKELKTAGELNPSLKEIYNQLGYCLYLKGSYIDAINAFEKAIEIDPGSAIDYANIASNLRKLGLKNDAIKFYDMALELDPSIEWAREHRHELMHSS